MRILPNLILLSLLLIFTGCASAPSPSAGQTVTIPMHPINYGDAAGGYTTTNQWYQLRDGVKYAWDGQDWFYLVRPATDAGTVGGAAVGAPECWQKVGGSHLQCYQRNQATFTDTSQRPVFAPY